MGNSATKENEEIIIKCTLEEMIKSFFKDYVIIWHDPNLNSQENQYFIKRLEKLYKVEPFIEWEKASKFIKETQTICHVITCGTNGEELIKEITSNDNVVHAYIFCQNKEYHTTWAQNYKKISCVETEIQNIIDQLEQNLFKWSKQVSSLKLDLPAFAPVFNDIDKSTMNHLHRYLKIIPNFKNRAEAKKDFLSLSKSIYSDPKNTGFIAEFEKDFNDYNKAQTLKWYTRESFLYKVTNNCLRIATSDSIQYCRLPLKDIEQAIKEEYQDKSKNFYGLLYRGAYISQSEWSSLKKNTDREIEMHGFLSVSQEKSVALKFLKKDASQKILITVIVPKGPNDEEQGFADIAEYSRFPKEKEILFNVRSRFTVLETEDEYSPDSPYRHLVLLYGAQGFRKFLSEENPVQDVEILDIDNISCARCKLKPQKTIFVSLEGQYYCCSECVDKINLYDPAPLLCIPILRNAEKMNRIRKVQGCFLLNSVEIDTPFYGYKCSKCQTKKQKKYLTCADCCSRENRWCENCFDDSLTCVQSEHNILFERRPFSFWCEKMSKSELNHLDYQKNLIKKDVFEQAQMHYESHQYEKAIKYFQIYIEQNENNEIDFNLMNSYNQMGFSFSIQGEYEKARNCYLKALDLIRTLDRENYPNISICLNNIGTTYGKEGKYQAALGYHFKSLEITKSLYEENDFQVTSCYNSIAITLGKLGDFQKALEYFQKALDITKSVHGENHPRLISCYNNLASVLSQLGDNDKALDFSLKSLHMSISLHGELHHHVALNYSNIGTVYHKQGKFNKAIECYSKSLDIKRVIQNELHPEVALVYNNMGMAFYDQGEYSKALECHLKSINIQKSVYGENDLNIAFYLNGLGQVYDAQGEYKKARECYMKALDIGESVHGKLLPLVAATYNRIGMNFYYQGDHNQALEYVMISLDLWISLFGENHPDIALTYSHIGLIYYKMEEHGKAMEYYKKSLNIGKPIHGKLHPLVATAEHNLALVYISLGKYEEALEYLFESLSIKKAIYGENHREVALWYDHIGAAFGKKGEYKMALEYLVKALDINKLHLGEFHPDVAYSYGNIGAIFIYQAEYDEGLKYLFRTLEIFKFISGEYSSEVATAYSTIGVTYQKQKKFNEALEYHFKALEVFQVVFGEYHHEVAISYENIGKTYFNLYEGDHGLEYCLKSLDIRISIYGTDHPETIFLQNLISQKLNP